jgi:hypothetical protein
MDQNNKKKKHFTGPTLPHFTTIPIVHTLNLLSCLPPLKNETLHDRRPDCCLHRSRRGMIINSSYSLKIFDLFILNSLIVRHYNYLSFEPNFASQELLVSKNSARIRQPRILRRSLRRSLELKELKNLGSRERRNQELKSPKQLKHLKVDRLMKIKQAKLRQWSEQPKSPLEFG